VCGVLLLQSPAFRVALRGASRSLFLFRSIFFPSYSCMQPETLWWVGQVGAVSDPTTLGVLRLSTAVRSANMFFQNRRTIGRAFQRIYWCEVAGMSDLKCISGRQMCATQCADGKAPRDAYF